MKIPDLRWLRAKLFFIGLHTPGLLAIGPGVMAVAIGLGGCAASTSDGAQVRFVNASNATSTLDLYYGSTKLFGSVKANSMQGYDGITGGTYTLGTATTGSTALLSSVSATVTTQQHYLVVAYGNDNGVNTVMLTEDDASPASGYAQVHVLNGAKDAGSVDVYLTSSSQAIDAVSPTVSSAAVGTATGFKTVSSGTYRLRVTGTGDSSDLRLDSTSLTLGDKSNVTLIVTPSAGGYLVNALSVVEQGSATAIANASARVRLVAGATAGAAVTATVGDTSLATSLPSPSIGAYTLVPAGTKTASISVGGAALAQQSVNLTGGADYTALVYGPASGATAALLTDDNQLPASTSKLKMRLVNAQYGSTGNMTLAVDYTAIASNIAYPGTSAYGTLTSTSSGFVQVTSSASSTSLYSASSVSLAAQSVYTMFMLGDTSTAGVLRKDR